MRSQSAARIGSQRPRIESVPLFHSSAADDAVDIAAAVGLDLDEWQEYVLRGALGEKPDGKWSAFRVALVVPRQNGKNAILEARELAGLFVFGERLIVHTAHQYRTAKGSMRSMMKRIKSCPELLELVDGYSGDPDVDPAGFKIGNNEPGITLKNGAQLQYATRGKDSGRGFTGDLVVLDEAYSLKVDEMAALVPTMAATSVQGNPQLWFTSSAGMPESDMLESLRESGKAQDNNRLAYYEWSTADDSAIDDRDAWYEANPGLGIRISEAFVEDELDTLVTEDSSGEQFKRERLGIWAKLGGESVIPSGVWRAGNRSDAEEVDTVAFAVDVPPSRDHASISMAGFIGDDLVSVALIDRREGTSWVPSRLAQLKAKWSPVAVVVDAKSAAGSLIPDIRSEGVRTKQVGPNDIGRACANFYDYAMQGRLVHPDEQFLCEAVEAARQRPLGSDGSAWAWSRKNVLTDISPLVAATLALHGLQSKGSRTAETTGRAVFI